MSLTQKRQETQVRPTTVYSDLLTMGATLESSADSLAWDLNALRSKFLRLWYADSVTDKHWYDDVPTINSKKRGLYGISDALNTVEEHKILYRDITRALVDLTVPSADAAEGTITTIAQALIEDGEKFVFNDGVLTDFTYWFDVSGTYTPPGGYDTNNIRVNISSDTSADDVRDRCISAINGSTVGITASSGGSATVSLVNDLDGTPGNKTITTTVDGVGWDVDGMSGGAGDVYVLSVSGFEAPTQVAAVGAATTEGAVVAVNTTFGTRSLAEVSGLNAISPINIVNIREAVTHDPLMSDDREVYALLQCESATNGHTFDDDDEQVMLSFVRQNSGGSDLEFVPIADIAGKAINYEYTRRVTFTNLPEQAFLSGAFMDPSALADMTLDNAIDNQVGVATQTQNIDWNIADTYELAFTADSGGTDLLKFSPTSGGNTLAINTTTLDVNLTNDADFSEGIKVDTTNDEIDIGVNAGHIQTTGTDDLHIQSASDLYLDDSYRTGWSDTNGVKLASAGADWTAYKTEFGEVSIMNALFQAKTSAKFAKVYAEVTANTVSAGTVVGGVGGGANLDAQLPDMSDGNFVRDHDVFVNGSLKEGDASSGGDGDYYPGTSLDNGQLIFNFKLYKKDKITVVKKSYTAA
jgi:hypothetical protein